MMNRKATMIFVKTIQFPIWYCRGTLQRAFYENGPVGATHASHMQPAFQRLSVMAMPDQDIHEVES